MKAYLHFDVICPECGRVMLLDGKRKGEARTVRCTWAECKLSGVEFHAPSVELVPVEHSASDQDSLIIEMSFIKDCILNYQVNHPDSQLCIQLLALDDDALEGAMYKMFQDSFSVSEVIE